MAVLSFSISVEVSGSCIALVLLCMLSLLMVRFNWPEFEVSDRSDRVLELECPSFVDDTDYFSVEEEFLWTEGIPMRFGQNSTRVWMKTLSRT